MVIVFALVLWGPRVATAQSEGFAPGDPTPQEEAERRPYRGLFGGGNPHASRNQLDLNGALYGSWYSNHGHETADVDRPILDGYYTAANGSLSYNRQWTRAELSTYGGGGVAYRPHAASGPLSSVFGGLAVTAPLGGRTTVSAHQTASHGTAYNLGLFSGLPPLYPVLGTPQDAAQVIRHVAADLTSTELNTSVGLQHELSSRTSARGFFDRHETLYDATYPDLVAWRAGGQFRRRFTESLAWRLGYGYRTGTYGFAEARTVRSHDIDIGVDYGKALSFSRRTRFTFSTGSTIVSSTGRPVAADPSSDTTTRFRFLGNAALTHEIGRTWHLQGVVDHSVEYWPAFFQPVIRTSASAGAGGLLGRRAQLDFRTAYSDGQVGFDTSNSNFDTFGGSADFHYALTRNFAASLGWFYYRYDFGRSVLLPPGVASQMNRQGIHVGLTVWAPLTNSRRGRHAAP
jgi:hypothetical protein